MKPVNNDHDGLIPVIPGSNENSPWSSDYGLQKMSYSEGKQVAPESNMRGWSTQIPPPNSATTIYELSTTVDRDIGTPKRRYCGMKPKLFYTLLAVLLVVIVAAAVGGGVGGSLASKSNNTANNGQAVQGSSSVDIPNFSSTAASGQSSTGFPTTIITTTSTSLPSSTTSTHASTATSGFFEYDCPADNTAQYNASAPGQSQTFEILCDVDWQNGAPGINGNTVGTFQVVSAKSIRDCIDQCGINHAGGGPCNAVYFGANLTLALLKFPGNCYMVNERSVDPLPDNSKQALAAWRISEP